MTRTIYKEPVTKAQKIGLDFAVRVANPDPALKIYANRIITELQRKQHQRRPLNEELNFVVNLVNIDEPLVYSRKRPEEFVVSFAMLKRPTADIRAACYQGLVKTLSNLFFGLLPAAGGGPPEVYYVTPEVGSVHFPFDPVRVARCMDPIIHAQLVLRNKLQTNLPDSKHIRVPEVDQLIRYGKKLDQLGLLPAPFPIKNLLSPDMIREIYDLYRIKGLSYGNLSVRGSLPGIEGTTFWMTARGVNKGKLQGVGKDILMVTGYDEESGRMLVSVPPDHDPSVRVSVDAIEHYIIYRSFPRVGAIVHVHAWMDDVLCTMQNYPCGSRQLADEVVRLLHQTDNPSQAAIGLKNHGLTITGHSLEDIFERIEGRLYTEVPMFE